MRSKTIHTYTDEYIQYTDSCWIVKTCEYTIDTINIVPQLTKHLFTSAAPFEKPYKLFSFMEIKINVLPGEGFARVCIFVCVCVSVCVWVYVCGGDITRRWMAVRSLCAYASVSLCGDCTTFGTCVYVYLGCMCVLAVLIIGSGLTRTLSPNTGWFHAHTKA